MQSSVNHYRGVAQYTNSLQLKLGGILLKLLAPPTDQFIASNAKVKKIEVNYSHQTASLYR